MHCRLSSTHGRDALQVRGAERGQLRRHSGIFGGVQPEDAGRHHLNLFGIVGVTPTEYMVATLGGDSGGSKFTVPAYNSTTGWYEISAADTMIGGTVKSGGALSGERPCIVGSEAGCDFPYMPIDRINDHDSNLAIRTGKGSYVVP